MCELSLFLFRTWRGEDCEISFTMYGNVEDQPIRGEQRGARRAAGQSQMSVQQSDAMHPMIDVSSDQ